MTVKKISSRHLSILFVKQEFHALCFQCKSVTKPLEQEMVHLNLEVHKGDLFHVESGDDGRALSLMSKVDIICFGAS